MTETSNRENKEIKLLTDNEPLVYNRISDAIDDKAKMKKDQNNIILKQTQKNHSALENNSGSYVSKRNPFRLYRSLSFINNSYTAGGFISCFLMIIAFCLMFYCLLMSVRLHGNVGTKVGFFALFSFVFSLFGFWIGLNSFKEKEKSYFFTRIGSYLSLALILFWVVMYIRGVLIK